MQNTPSLLENPFFLLGATPRDDRRRILELAEEKSLDLDPEVCQKARADLTNPRTRLSAEMAWLPGVAPRRLQQLVDTLALEPMRFRQESNLPPLAHLNLLTAAFDTAREQDDAADLAAFIQEFASLADELTPEDVLADINADRTVSGFPELRTVDQVEAELSERKRSYRNTIKGALDELPATRLVQAMTLAVDGATASGTTLAPELIDALVDSYDVEALSALQAEANNVRLLIEVSQKYVGTGASAIKRYIDQLASVTRNWATIARPIQLSMEARGIRHAASCDLAYQIRGLAIELCNKHDMLSLSLQLTAVLQEQFSHVPDVAEHIAKDAADLAAIISNRSKQ